MESKDSGDTSHSICPKGWRLPTQTEYITLITQYGGNNATGGKALQASPANFKKGGYYRSGSPNEVGGYGYYWSSTAADSNYAWYLFFDDSIAVSNYSRNKYVGFSVRCVARQ